MLDAQTLNHLTLMAVAGLAGSISFVVGRLGQQGFWLLVAKSFKSFVLGASLTGLSLNLNYWDGSLTLILSIGALMGYLGPDAILKWFLEYIQRSILPKRYTDNDDGIKKQNASTKDRTGGE